MVQCMPIRFVDIRCLNFQNRSWLFPADRIYKTEKFSEMLAQNHLFFFRQSKRVPVWVLVGVAHSAQEADTIRKQADHELSARKNPRIPSDEEMDAERGELDAYLRGHGPEPIYPSAPPPWWFSEK